MFVLMHVGLKIAEFDYCKLAVFSFFSVLVCARVCVRVCLFVCLYLWAYDKDLETSPSIPGSWTPC